MEVTYLMKSSQLQRDHKQYGTMQACGLLKPIDFITNYDCITNYEEKKKANDSMKLQRSHRYVFSGKTFEQHAKHKDVLHFNYVPVLVLLNPFFLFS